eukprot:TRINITY_DN6398_c0_g1_i11.p1 TRINITY_DN6398_c0_g1~~TRINITY_DN6398_c0_g1_i11.p1  ORF type:complete len:666 (+),score=149.75 TRINITY_DN6398_c0_g1_i11:156-2153(+)
MTSKFGGEETWKFFCDRIPAGCSFKANLWLCNRIGHHFDISIDSFLPRIVLPSAFLSKICEEISEGNVNAVQHSFAHTATSAEITCTDLITAKEINEDLGRAFVKPQGHQQAASALQITKDELLSFCEDARRAAGVHQRLKKPQSSLQAILDLECTEPSLFDYVKLAYVFSHSRELLLKVMAIAPNLTFSFRSIKGFPAINNNVLKRVFGRAVNSFETGLLTLDRDHRVVLIDSDDPNASTYPLIGLWVAGLAASRDKKGKTLKDARVMAAIMRFLFSDEIKVRVASGRKESRRSFVLVSFGEATKITPQFFEFELPEKDQTPLNNWMLLEGTCKVKRDRKGKFSPLQIQLTCRQDLTQHIDYSVYKLSQILHSLPLSRPKCRGKENANPCSAKAQLRTKDSLGTSQARTKNYSTAAETRHVPFHSKPLSNAFEEPFLRPEEHSTIDSIYNQNCNVNGYSSIEEPQEDECSNDENEEQLMQVVMENSKSIQMMHQFVMQLTQQLMEIKSSAPQQSNESLPADIQYQFTGVQSKEGNVSFSLDASSIDPKPSYCREEGSKKLECGARSSCDKGSEELYDDDQVKIEEDKGLITISTDLKNKENLVRVEGSDKSIRIPRIIDIDFDNGSELSYHNKKSMEMPQEAMKRGGSSYLNVMLLGSGRAIGR